MNKVITLPNGGTAIDFTPEDSREKAIVHLHVLQRLARLLPQADPEDIIRDHTDVLADIVGRAEPKDMLKEAVSASAEFVAFHVTVNLIQTFVPEKDMPDNMPKVVGKIKLEGIDDQEEVDNDYLR